MLRFLVDENVPVEIGLGLQSRGHDTLIVARTPLRGSADTVLWARAVKALALSGFVVFLVLAP